MESRNIFYLVLLGLLSMSKYNKNIYQIPDFATITHTNKCKNMTKKEKHITIGF